MPWYYNARSSIVRVRRSDGELASFPPRGHLFVDADNVSADFQPLIDGNILKYRGDGLATIGSFPDISISLTPPVTETEDLSVEVPMEVTVDTSNDIYQVHDNLPNDLPEIVQIIPEELIKSDRKFLEFIHNSEPKSSKKK